MYILHGPGSSVGIATDYGLETVQGSNPGGGEIFRTRPDRPWGHPASCTMSTGSFPRVQWPGRGADHPCPFSRRGWDWVRLYLNSPSGPLVACYRVNFTFYHIYFFLFFLELWIFQVKVVQKITTLNFMVNFPPKIVLLMGESGKILYNRTGHRWQYNTAHAHYMLHT
jgi:hypothetical protein